VVILLNGRHAGKKAIVVKTFEDGTKDREFGHCLIAGIDRYEIASNIESRSLLVFMFRSVCVCSVAAGGRGVCGCPTRGVCVRFFVCVYPSVCRVCVVCVC